MRSLRFKAVLANPKFIQMSRVDWRSYYTVTTCHVCQKSPAVRGAAPNEWNLMLKLNVINNGHSVVFYNMRSYDFHLLMQAISKVESKISCIPNNTEKYTSFYLGQLHFIYSI